MFKPKLKEDEPMDTGEITGERNYGEEGEIQSDDEEVFWAEGKTTGNKVLSKATSYGLPPSSISELKKLSRAKRFGIPIEHGRTALVNTALITRLYKSLGIDESNEKKYRFNAVHMWGTQNMSTEDVYEYFKSFKPNEVEWINDCACNIVWTDHFSAAKALLKLSKEIKNLDKICSNADPFKKRLKLDTKQVVLNPDADIVDAREIEGPIPPGQWRIGVPAEGSSTILLRLAAKSDKKQRFAEKNSEYYKKYGNPHFGNIPGIVSSSLRSEVFRHYKQSLHNYSVYLQDKKKNPWGYLAEQWRRQEVGTDARSKLKSTKEGPLFISDLRLTLSNKPVDMPKKKTGSKFQSSKSASDKARGKFPKMKMYADEEAKLRVTTVKLEEARRGNVPYVEDLRQRINRSRKRKQLIEEEMKNKRLKFCDRSCQIKASDFGKEGDDSRDFDDDIAMGDAKEFDNDCDPDNGEDADVGIDDDEDDDERCSNWALENYSDLRNSVTQDKKYKKKSDAKKPEKSKAKAEGKDGGDDDDEDDMFSMDINDRSPLQIEFENDDYFEKESN